MTLFYAKFFWIEGLHQIEDKMCAYVMYVCIGIDTLLRASLVPQRVKSAVQETWVWSLNWEDPLEKGMATHSSILAWRISMDRGAWWTTVRRVMESRTQLSD